MLPGGKVRYELARPWPTPTGVTELIMEPLQFLKRLAALLPAPYQNLVRYHGVFANRSRYRQLLPLPPEANRDESRDDDADAHSTSHPCCNDDPDPNLVGSLPAAEEQTLLPLEEPDDPAACDDSGGSADPYALDGTSDNLPDLPVVRPRRLPWASLLRRSLGACPREGGG